MHTEVTYILYIIASIALTVWVGKTLHRHGHVFLVDAMHGNEKLADSVNHLLVVGFYLINIGYVTLALKFGTKPTDLREAIEFFSTKIGLVLVVLGIMHFFNLFVLSRLRHRALWRDRLNATAGQMIESAPPISADAHIAHPPLA